MAGMRTRRTVLSGLVKSCVVQGPPDLRPRSSRSRNEAVSTGVFGAGGGNRTHTGLMSPQDFKSCASASFATPASVAMLRDGNNLPFDIDEPPHCPMRDNPQPIRFASRVMMSPAPRSRRWPRGSVPVDFVGRIHEISLHYAVGWSCLALINAGLEQSKGRRGLIWFLVSLLLGPMATFAIVVTDKPAPALPQG